MGLSPDDAHVAQAGPQQIVSPPGSGPSARPRGPLGGRRGLRASAGGPQAPCAEPGSR